MDSTLHLTDAGHRDIALDSLKQWLPTATLHFEPMPGGRSGAELVSVDVSGRTGDLPPGMYVLRVGPEEEDLAQANELAAHQLIRDADPAFAERHLPRLLRLNQRRQGDVRLVASLHQIAGDSLGWYTPPRIGSTGLLRSAYALSRDIMDAWADPSDITQMRPYDLLVSIAGESRVAECLAAVPALFTGEVHHEDGHAFLDPLTVLGEGEGGELPVMGAICHGDLNTGNVLVPRDEVTTDDDSFWIVDVDQARRSIAGFDPAYLEVSVLVNILPMIRRPVLARCLEAAEDATVKSVPDDCQWLVEFLQNSRTGLLDWVSRQPGRMDQLRRQFMLVRIAAALLWARRFPADDERARLCLAYAGWYALRYRRAFAHTARPSEATARGAAGVPVSGAAPETVSASAQATGATPAEPGRDGEEEVARVREDLWESFWGTVSGFAPHAARWVLVAEQLPRTASVSALGRIPWSLVVDLDPASDGDGLHHRAGPVLTTQRAVHLFTEDRPVIDYARGTAWLLAAGSVLRREPALEGREWVIRRLDTVRRVTSSFHQFVGDTPVYVLVLEGGTETAPAAGRDRLLRVVEAMDEMLQGQATFVHVGLADLRPDVPLVRVPLPVGDLLERLTATLGTSGEYLDYTVPALDNGTAPISPETMQKLREHLVVLHDGIEASTPPGDRNNNDAFWRGGLISWDDLDAGRDVVRTVNDGLVAALRDSLRQHRTRTVVVEHRPGAGGTTAALRAAWDLHQEFPVAVLPHGVPIGPSRVPLLADRLHLLYTITQLPVLLVAEGGDLSEAYREALYRESARRNTPLTVLYVRRGVTQANRGALQVSEPLDDKETAEFQGRYAALTEDRHRIDELRMLGTRTYERYRTPFFYGLITFEREFTKLSTYVQTHLDHVRGRAREVMQYLALATIYSNTGLQRETVQKLMHVSTPSAELDLSDVLGPEASRLVAVRNGRVRLQHQLLAEQVLAELLNDHEWTQHLKDLSIDFIKALSNATDVSSDPVRVLLRQMFVDRQGGTADGVEDRRNFAPLIERLDLNSAHQVLKTLTEEVPDEPHFWNHLGRHQMYRLRRELDKAEEYVTRAVELAEWDFLHHHTLGLARRSRMRQALRDAKRRGVPAVMAAADRWFAQTVECFATARNLNPENIYGYITHVQAIVDVAKAVKDAARVSSIAELSSDASEWVTENLAEANFLLNEAAQLYGTLDQHDDYLVRCQTSIKRLYGDLDSVVELWELAVAGARSTPMMQRALAQAYYVRGGRSWRELDPSELARIVELARQNLSRTGCKEEDYRLWFEAYKLLPDFDIDEALSQLQLWSDRFPSWRAHYYRYCLFFHLWFTGSSSDVEAFRVEQQQAEKYVVGRSNRSYLWLSTGPEWYPLIADSDLGEWNRREMFWTNTTHLQRVNGVIDFIRGPQAGTIQLEGSVTAFFVPSRGTFLPDSDENTPVNFFLGLSPEGPRAWDVQRGHLDHALQARQTVSTGPARALAARAPVQLAPAQVAAHAATLTRQRKLDFCVSLLEAWQTVGDAPPLSRLAERVGARFRYDGADVTEILAESGRVYLDADGSDPVVRLRDADGGSPGRTPADRRLSTGEGTELGRITFVNPTEGHGIVELVDRGWARFTTADIRTPHTEGPVRGQVVRAVMVEMDRGGGRSARGLELFPLSATLVDGEIVDVEHLAERVSTDLRQEIEERLSDGVPSVPARELEEWLEERFTGCRPLADRLGLSHLGRLWVTLDWLKQSGSAGNRTVSLRSGTVFGRVPPPRREQAAPQQPARRPDEFGEALEAVVTEIERAGGGRATFYRVKNGLVKRLRKDFERVVGGSLKSRIARQPGWSLQEIRPGVHVVQRTDGPDGAGAKGTGTKGTGTKGTAGRAPAKPSAAESAAGPASGSSAAGARSGPALGPHGAALGPEAFLPLFTAEVDRIVRAGGTPTLQSIGVALRARLGPAFAAVVGASLKKRVEREPGWRVDEPRPGVHVPCRTGPPPAAPAAAAAAPPAAAPGTHPTASAVSPPASSAAPSASSAPPAAPPDPPRSAAGADVAAALRTVVARLLPHGGEAPLPDVGNALRELWGADAYRAVTGTRSLRLLVQEHGWETHETKPTIWVLRAPGAGPSTEG
ncbi:hypothetical protein ACGF1Z_27385 [Streptomyces sp. NPDC048018]|uniref:hypothetical protein n=1 Tax=Streptomyces sp. NPDC048018 TaxID=3365499 RepID=UPI003714500C